MRAVHSARDGQTFYLYVSSLEPPILTSDSVFYRVAGKQSATQLCRLFRKEYSSESGSPGFFLKFSAEVDPDEQILLDEAIAWLDVYVDPDTGVYDPPPTEELMVRAEYARRAREWETIIGMRTVSKRGSPIDEDADQIPDKASPETADRSSDQFQMAAEDRRNSGLNLLFLLAQAYYKILECVISTTGLCCALDLELNESYLWTIANLKNLLANHKDLQDFPGTFEPAFSDLYPSTIRDVDWEDMVAPDVEQFLSTVQKYVQSKGTYSPEELSPSWAFIEMFRPSIETAIERAVAYDKRMRNYAREAFGKNSGTATATDRDSSRSTAVIPDTPLPEAAVYIAAKISETPDSGECFPRTRDFIRQVALNAKLTIWGKQQLAGANESVWKFDSCLVEIPAGYWKAHRLNAIAFATEEPRKPLNANVPYTLPLRRDQSNPRGWENSYADLHVNRQQVIEQLNLPVEPKTKRGPIYDSRDPDIVRRRFIVAQNRDTEAGGLCSLFDNSSPPIPLPPRMRESGTWIKAYRIPRYKHAIDSLVSRDRRKVGV
jgi:hypothetical protein